MKTIRIRRRPNPQLRALLAANALLDPNAFRQWLAEQPADRVLELNDTDEIFTFWLRETGQAPDAALVSEERSDGETEYQTCRLNGVLVEVPGIFFYFYGEGYTQDADGAYRLRAGSCRAAWDAMMREHYADWPEYWEAATGLVDCGEAVSTAL